MQKKYKLAARLIVTVIAMGAHFAYADDDISKKSFEDGLKKSISTTKERESDFDSAHEGSWKEYDDDMHVTMVPEPATDAMLLAGLAVLLVAARRKKVSKSQ
jgi:hypothetical protein